MTAEHSPDKRDLVFSPEQNLSRYLREISHYPMLTRENELAYAKQCREKNDSEAIHHLVTSHLRLVAKIAMGYRGYGLPIGEVISEGNVGLMQAVVRFDPDKGFRLSTYAMWWIKAAIQEYILHSWSLVKIGTTAHQKKLFFNLRKLKNRMQAFEEGDMTPEHVSKIAETLSVPEQEVLNMDRRLAGHDHSLNAPLQMDGAGEWQDFLVEEGDNQETKLVANDENAKRLSLLQRAMSSLNDREQRIISERRLQDKATTLEDLSREYGISRERVRQIEVRAFEKLQKLMQNASFNQLTA